MPITGWVNLCRTACSAGGALRQMSTSAGTVMTSGQPSGPSQETPAEDTMSRTRMTTEARAAACAMPRRSVTAVLAMPRLSPPRRDQQPGQHVGRRAEAADQAGHHEDGPDDGHVPAGLGGQPGGHPADHAVVPVAAQRPVPVRPARPAAQAHGPALLACGPPAGAGPVLVRPVFGWPAAMPAALMPPGPVRPPGRGRPPDRGGRAGRRLASPWVHHRSPAPVPAIRANPETAGPADQGRPRALPDGRGGPRTATWSHERNHE